ncbi:MAG: hypothetical protein U5R46_15270 [Gammaproteobacteria bacterium]|nr:hypothetical protein [Gammaproteobacteria bacterium]
MLVAGFAFFADTLQELVGGFELVGVVAAPLFGEAAFEGGFEQGLAVGLELGAGGFQAFHALVQFGEEGFDLGDDAALFVAVAESERQFFDSLSLKLLN